MSVRLYVRLFIYMGLPFGVVMGTFFGMRLGAKTGFISGLLQGIFFGLAMSLTLGRLHNSKTKKMRELYGEDVKPKCSETVTIEGDLDTVFSSCQGALKEIGGEKAKIETAGRTVVVEVPMTWKSFGEIVKTEVQDTEDGTYEVVVSSSPKVKTTLVDYGKGRQNVNKVIEFLKTRTS